MNIFNKITATSIIVERAFVELSKH